MDQDSSDLVVIELRRGRTIDSSVGQILRYMSWAEENIAEAAQGVRGIMIAREVDDALEYAVKNQSIIEVNTYEVDFRLSSFQK